MVHKSLEDQVHTTVAVDLVTKVDVSGRLVWNAEDAWGLRIWNVIQGLRTLRECGMTRELEVWGIVDGLLVNGIIDELSYVCPDRELEEAGGSVEVARNRPAADQTSITDFLGSAGTLETNGRNTLSSLRATTQKESEKIYITDVKTRGVKSVPKGASFRPTLMQLMIYRRLLSDLASDKVDADVIFERYELNSEASLSDSFIAQIGNLNEDLLNASEDLSDETPKASQEPPVSSQDSMAQLLEHNSLRSLWTFMIEEFAETLPLGARSIGNVLKAEYRNQTDGDILGAKTFMYDEETLSNYLRDGMQWWRGERAARGVCIEEAYKCNYCEFSEECSWRKNKVEDATERMRDRRRSAI